MAKRVIILIGPKGSGKSHIGRLMESGLNIPFFSVEPLFLALMNDPQAMKGDFIRGGFMQVEATIHERLKKDDSLVFEATGLTPYFETLLVNLESQYRVTKVKIEAPIELCLSRIRQRDTSVHIPVSDEMISHIHNASSTVELEFDLVIDNASATTETILEHMSQVMNCQSSDCL
jgi:predicted kinase